jgi:GntR family transcriptional regulator/MocR family aminotransferase
MKNNRILKKRMSLAGMHLQRMSPLSLHQQIAAHMHSGILRGIFPAGTQFLGSREVARQLGCSRTVVLTAWELLYAEGYLESTPRGGVTVASINQFQAGATVAPAPPAETGAVVHAGSVSRRWRSLLESEYDTNWKSEFAPGAPDISGFPFREWARLLRQSWQDPIGADCVDLPAAGRNR